MLSSTLALSQAKPWDLALLRRMYPSLVDAIDTPYARVAISGRDSQVAVFENGALAFDTEGTSAEAFADLAAVQHANPRRALVIGGGGEGVPAALVRHGIPVIHDLEIDERALDLVRAHTASAGSTPPAGGPVAVIFAEPRRYLERAEQYDLILVAAGEPTSGAASRFYTREFFAHARAGWPAAASWPSGWQPRRTSGRGRLARRTASIVAALRLGFTSVELVAGPTFTSSRRIRP